MTLSGSAPFRPRARLIRLLGEELISDEVMAVVELVKNAYDADASNVTIRLSQLHDPMLAQIEVLDDGAGMALQTLLDAWMEPATTFKRREGRKRRTPKGRYPLGEKGVGRFAADKLGAELELVSRAAGAQQEVHLTVFWEAFAESEYLDEVRSVWEARDPVEFTAGRHGTAIRIRRLRVPWDRALVERVSDGLARLLSPAARRGDFRIYVECPDFPDLTGAIENRLLETAPYRLTGFIDACGRLSRHGSHSTWIDLRTHAGEHFRTHEGLLRAPACGPFSISLSVWDLDALGQHGVRMTRSLRAFLRRASGVSIYRDGFRVAPYGNPGEDWLELNQRRVNNPTMRVSTNQIVGAVEITQEANPDLRDRTSREGLIENQAFRDLKSLVIAALSRLEEERYARRKAIAPPALPPGTDPVLGYLERARAERGGGVALRAATIAYRRYREEAERREQALLRLASVGAAARSLLAQLNGSVASLMGQLPFLRGRLFEPQPLDQLEARLRIIRQQLDALERLFGGRAPVLSRFDLRALAQDALMIYQPLLSSAAVRTSIAGPAGVMVAGDRSAVLHALLLVLENAILAAMEQPEDRRVLLAVERQPTRLIVSDSGPGIPQELRGHIFDPFFTGREGRDGLGLALAQTLLRGSGAELRLGEQPTAFELAFEGA